MSVVVIVGTDKGAVLLRADDAREHWRVGTTSGHVLASRDRGDSWTELRCTLPRILSVEAFAP